MNRETETILTGTHLNKSFGKHDAVCNLDLVLEPDTIYGLFGRNGAGKTTLLDMLTGSSFPGSGEITVSGKRLHMGDTPRDICYVRERNLFIRNAKIMEILEVASAYHKYWDWAFAHELVKIFKLNPNKKISQLSRGMESMVGNLIGLASRAPITLFDEPVLGLDVLMREKFYRLLADDCAKYPRTVLLSTHLIDEIAEVVEKVYVMEAGSILLHDEADNIRNQSHVIRGDREAVLAFKEGKRVIHQESDGNNDLLAAIYDKIGDADRAKAAEQGISITGLPLQKFFAYLIEEGDRVG
ncbi:ATP-binding cassette domain-containing protein [Paenibacillus nasutitermitis]|uniref:ABC transporter ATP-binding protein n=1 Tax=Paenibacillus nasutitermitis TaxID=1652958 RepID=A0A917DP34_9BACL|nr:ABC transporter ATP-binding protein [Paenibacillus nasutitermitis]GGD55623.1 ABC transporter ATP-binding protein [Paenibacillus nasutitermitis]